MSEPYTAYREALPVAGQPVPDGCEWDWGYGEWFPVRSCMWSFEDCLKSTLLGIRYRYPIDSAPSENWFNTLSLD